MSEKNIEHIRHTLAHLLAQAVLSQYPHAKVTLGPAIENGFYYDFDFTGGDAPTEKELAKLTKAMRKALPRWTTWEHKKVSTDEARKHFADNAYKLELIEEIVEKGEDITLYTCGEFTDLCRGGHTETPNKDIDPQGFVLDKVAGAYWRGDEKNTMLTRIYGLAFESKEALDEFLEMREEAKKRDHKKLGKELDLFVNSEVVGKGLPLFTPKGATVRRELERFIVDEEIKRGYQHVYTPDIAKIDLYKKSGHYPHYKDSMYPPITIDDEQFMLRPMTCPHHYELFLSKRRTYKELPMRIAELAQLYRYEQSGELSGLQRVRTFCLADAHIICASPEQAAEEVNGALDLIEYVSTVFGLQYGKNYWYRLSLGDRNDAEKYYKNDIAWEKGESLLRKVLKERGKDFVEAEKEAAFYGPKIDVQMKNVNGKEDTAFTVQYDFCMPDRFELDYIAEDASKKRAVVVHRSSIGAIERVMAFLIEHYAGAFPLWLAPEQVRVLPVAQAHDAYAQKVYEQLQAAGIRAELSPATESLGKRIRNVKMDKVPYFLVLGDEEAQNETVTAESRECGKESPKPLADVIIAISEKITSRTR